MGVPNRLPNYAAERKHVRYALDVRARLSASGQEITARTLEISEGGVGLVSPREIAEGSTFVLRLELPSVQGEFQALVKQESRNGFRYGFSFVSLDEASRALLQKFQRRMGVRAKEGYAGAG